MTTNRLNTAYSKGGIDIYHAETGYVLARVVDKDYEWIATLLLQADKLSAKYDLSKLEAATEKLRKAWESAIEGEMPLAVDDFLTAITRQPAGEKQT